MYLKNIGFTFNYILHYLHLLLLRLFFLIGVVSCLNTITVLQTFTPSFHRSSNFSLTNRLVIPRNLHQSGMIHPRYVFVPIASSFRYHPVISVVSQLSLMLSMGIMSLFILFSLCHMNLFVRLGRLRSNFCSTRQYRSCSCALVNACLGASSEIVCNLYKIIHASLLATMADFMTLHSFPFRTV